MEKLIKLVSEKTGITETQAKGAVDTVIGFLKDKMPAGIGNQVESFVKGSTVSGIAGGIKKEIGDVFGK
jgi:hypothetical protein